MTSVFAVFLMECSVVRSHLEVPSQEDRDELIPPLFHGQGRSEIDP